MKEEQISDEEPSNYLQEHLFPQVKIETKEENIAFTTYYLALSQDFHLKAKTLYQLVKLPTSIYGENKIVFLTEMLNQDQVKPSESKIQQCFLQSSGVSGFASGVPAYQVYPPCQSAWSGFGTAAYQATHEPTNNLQPVQTYALDLGNSSGSVSSLTTAEGQARHVSQIDKTTQHVSLQDLDPVRCKGLKRVGGRKKAKPTKRKPTEWNSIDSTCKWSVEKNSNCNTHNENVTSVTGNVVDLLNAYCEGTRVKVPISNDRMHYHQQHCWYLNDKRDFKCLCHISYI